MRILILSLIIVSVPQFSHAGIELLVGIGVGKYEFAIDSPRNDSYSGTSFEMQGSARGTLTKGRIQIGAGITRASGSVNLESSSAEDSSTEFKHLFYGPVLGYIINKNFRLDFEYYTDSTIEVTKSDDNPSDVFRADDKIFGKGFGVGVSLLRGYLMTQLLYQSFSTDRVEINEVENDANSDEANSFKTQKISLQFGLLF